MTDLKQLNRERLTSIKVDGMSHGLEVLINEIQQAQRFNAEQPQTRRNGEEYRRKIVTVYFTWVTDNRLVAHIIVDHQPMNGSTETLSIRNGKILSGSIFSQPRLARLVIPEAGHRLYAHYKDGYQANGGGYSKPFHILERMVWEAKKHIDVNQGVGHWQDFIKCEVIA